MSNKKVFKKLYSKKFNKEENYNIIINNIERDSVKIKKSNKLILVPIYLIAIACIGIMNFNNNSTDKLLNNNSNNKDKTGNNANEENHNVQFIKGMSSMDAMLPKSLYKDSEYVAIVKIESIDGADTYNSVLDEYVLPYTYGKMRILKVIKGDIKVGSIVNFNRLGGRVTLEQWYNCMTKLKQEKFDNYQPILERPYEEVDYSFESDISIESEKVYLAYFSEYVVRIEDENSYELQFFEYGLREVKNQKITDYSNIDLDKIEVLDNHSGEYEKLSSVIEKY